MSGCGSDLLLENEQGINISILPGTFCNNKPVPFISDSTDLLYFLDNIYERFIFVACNSQSLGERRI